MWNTNNYAEPSGHKSSSGFSEKYGYGHEEWNNNPNLVWRNFKVFHTESKPILLDYSVGGNLGIVMITSYKSNHYAVGIATNVFKNEEEEVDLLTSELNIFDNYNQVWQQATVQKAFKFDFNKFMKHWSENYKWIKWKCPVENYLWFEKPIRLNPIEISGKNRLISMHGSYQKILPQVALKLLKNQLNNSPKIIDWLTTGEFNTDWVQEKSEIQSNSALRKKYLKNGGNAPSKNTFSYWVEGQRNIEPLHAKLQAKFVLFLSKQGIVYTENEEYVDVKYKKNSKEYFCEIKPTENLDSKYAIRLAVGQLLEYQYYQNKEAILEIVLSSKPRKEEIQFIKSLNIQITYFDKIANEFKTE